MKYLQRLIFFLSDEHVNEWFSVCYNFFDKYKIEFVVKVVSVIANCLMLISLE